MCSEINSVFQSQSEDIVSVTARIGLICVLARGAGVCLSFLKRRDVEQR